MKKLIFVFNISLLLVSLALVSCGKRCIDPNANNSNQKGECVYPADEFKGVYTMTCNCTPKTGSGSNISKTFDVEVLKIDNSNVAIKNIQGCGGSVNANLFARNYTAHYFSYSAICDGTGYNIDGDISIVPSTGDLTLSYDMTPSDLSLSWYDCTATGTRK